MNQKHTPIDKLCKKCDQTTSHRWDGCNNRYCCKKCRNAANRRYRQTAKYKAQERAYRPSYIREKKQDIKERLVAFFGGECELCHLKDPCLSIYEFHHKDPDEKDLNIALINTWKKAFKEASKCQLLCANCHRRLHYELRMHKKKS